MRMRAWHEKEKEGPERERKGHEREEEEGPERERKRPMGFEENVKMIPILLMHHFVAVSLCAVD